MKVLVAPLDWGLGHAARCVPIIRELLNQGAEVEIGSVKSTENFFREIFPNLRQRMIPAYNVQYPKFGINMGLWLLKNSKNFKKFVKFEQHYAEEMVEKFHYDVIISDNRFGFYSKKAYSIYMTHQCRIAFPRALAFGEFVGIRWHYNLMKPYNEVWVPDEKENGFAGNLSHVKLHHKNMKFIGLLSRFKNATHQKETPKNISIFAVISGVEPARTHFEKQVKNILKKIPGKHRLVLGKPYNNFEHTTDENIEIFSHLPLEEFAKSVEQSQWVLSRGGYSTLMDLAHLKAKCILVPTPGQNEQILLAQIMEERGSAVYIPELQFSEKSLKKALQKEVIPLAYSGNTNLALAIKKLKKRVEEK